MFLALGLFPEINRGGSLYDRLPSSLFFHPHLILSFSNNPVQVGPQALEKSIDSSVTSSAFWTSQIHHYSHSTIVMNEQKFTATLQKSVHCEETEFYMKVKRYQGGTFLQDLENVIAVVKSTAQEKNLLYFSDSLSEDFTVHQDFLRGSSMCR